MPAPWLMRQPPRLTRLPSPRIRSKSLEGPGEIPRPRPIVGGNRQPAGHLPGVCQVIKRNIPGIRRRHLRVGGGQSLVEQGDLRPENPVQAEDVLVLLPCPRSFGRGKSAAAKHLPVDPFIRRLRRWRFDRPGMVLELAQSVGPDFVPCPDRRRRDRRPSRFGIGFRREPFRRVLGRLFRQQLVGGLDSRQHEPIRGIGAEVAFAHEGAGHLGLHPRQRLDPRLAEASDRDEEDEVG